MKRWLQLVMVVLSTHAAAMDCAPPEGTTSGVASQSAEARLTFLSSLLEEEGRAGQRWTLGWGAAYGVATLTQVALAGLFPAEERPDWYWGALSTAVGVAFSVVDPLEAMEAGPRFATQVRTVTPRGTCQLILEGERLVREGAAHEELGRAWFIHAGNVLFNLGIGLVLGLGYGHWTSGAINAAVGAAIGEATIFTSPNRLTSGWRTYRTGSQSPAFSVRVVPTPGPGMAVRLEF